MSDLSSLAARVAAATGPDRELDKALWEALTPHPHNLPLTGGFWTYGYDPPLTYSIDSSLALVEKLLPGWSWSIDTMSVPPGEWSKVKRLPRVQLAEPVKTKYGDGVGIRAQTQGATPSLAILAALLKALEAADASQARRYPLDERANRGGLAPSKAGAGSPTHGEAISPLSTRQAAGEGGDRCDGGGAETADLMPSDSRWPG